MPGIGDAIAQGIARIVSIKNEAGTLTPARFEEFERSTLDACLELGRCVVREVLEDQDAQLSAEIEQDGAVLRRRPASRKTITTLLGPVSFERSRYRTRGSGPSHVPVDERLGLIDGHLTRPAARISVLLMSQCPARDAHEILAEIGAFSPSVSTLQRVTRSMHVQLEALSGEERALIRCAEDIPPDVHSMSVSLDGVMVAADEGEDGRTDGSWAGGVLRHPVLP